MTAHGPKPASVSRFAGHDQGLRRLTVLVVGILLYGAVSTAAMVRNWHHYELISLFLQAVLLLPAVTIGLKGHHVTSWIVKDASSASAWRFLVVAFLVIAAGLNCLIVRGITNPDESSYRFQARILAGGHIMAPPPNGAPERPVDAAVPLNFNHHVIWKQGWFSKYPIVWPLLLAIPEKLGFPWLVNPLLASGILVCIAAVARMAYSPVTAVVAVGITVLSPYFFAQCLGRMSHGLAGLLTAAACLLCLDGLRRRKLSRFAIMFLLIILAFHVRPFTALIVAVVLSVSVLVCLRRERALAFRFFLIATAAAIAAAGSIFFYNWMFTGNGLLSPYAFEAGLKRPAEISASLPQILSNLKTTWRFSAQSTMLFSFPFVLPLAALGFWKNRHKTPASWILAALFCGIVLEHLVQFESASVIGERYWFEGFFALAILATEGVRVVVTGLKAQGRHLAAAACAFAIIQISMSAAVAGVFIRRTSPPAAVRAIAESFQGCACVVFLKSSPPDYYGNEWNLNAPTWKDAEVFYAVDPGPDGRQAWSRTLGYDHWVVVTYDPVARTGTVVGSDISNGKRLD